MHALRIILLTLSAFVAGLAIGHFGTSSDSTTRTEGVDRLPALGTGTGTHLASPPSLAGRRHTPRAIEPRVENELAPGRARLTPGSAAAPAGDDAGPPWSDGVLEVRVTDANDVPVYAQVYAMPRDATEWYESPECSHEPPGPCRLRLPSPGTYDVFARIQSPPGVAGREDVTLRAGERVRVHLKHAPAAPIHFVAARPWSIRDALRSGALQGSLHLLAANAPGWRVEASLRGRAHGVGMRLHRVEGPWTSPPLTAGLQYRIRVDLKVPADRRSENVGLPAFDVVAEPPRAHPGDTVSLHVRRLAHLRVHFVRPPDSEWPDGPLALDVRLEHASGTREESYRWSTWTFGRKGRRRILTGTPGPARLHWDGPGILAGEIDGLLLTAGENREQQVMLAFDPSEFPSHDPLTVAVAGLGADPTYEADVELALSATLTDEVREDRSALEWSGTATSEVVLDLGWRRASHLVAWLGQRHVSRAVEIPRQGPITVRLEPAGHALVVPDRLPDEALGLIMRIRHADGVPFLVAPNKSDRPVLRRSAIVHAGDLVGPLPAGRHVFEVEVMGRRRANAVVDVLAGRLGVLHVD